MSIDLVIGGDNGKVEFREIIFLNEMFTQPESSGLYMSIARR